MTCSFAAENGSKLADQITGCRAFSGVIARIFQEENLTVTAL
jgi:hypothetical protein